MGVCGSALRGGWGVGAPSVSAMRCHLPQWGRNGGAGGLRDADVAGLGLRADSAGALARGEGLADFAVAGFIEGEAADDQG